MLENLFNLIKEQGQETVINNPAVPNEQNHAVLASATSSVAEGLQGVLAGGGLSDIMSMFGGTHNSAASSNGLSGLLNNPIVGNIISSFTSKLTNQHGIAPDQASSIAGSLIPGVISKLITRTQDPNDGGFDMNNIIGSLTGGAQGGGFDLQGMLSKFSGGSLDTDGDGKVELSDIVSKVTGGAKQQQSGGAGGGLMDMIKGFMG